MKVLEYSVDAETCAIQVLLPDICTMAVEPEPPVRLASVQHSALRRRIMNVPKSTAEVLLTLHS
jgi:hypothetical protein